MVVDVGSCKGEFIQALVDRFPNKNFVLFEIRVPLAQRLRSMFKDHSNVVVFEGDAGLNFKNILKPSIDRGVMVEEIYVNFPDPWFKERHKKRRFISSKFLSESSSYVSAETKWVFQTDQEFIFRETVEVLEKSAFNQIKYFNAPPYGVRTNWEVATMREGRCIWRMEFLRSRIRGN